MYKLLVGLLVPALLASGCASTGRPVAPALVNHVVVVWVKDQYRNERGIEELLDAQESLRQIPGLVSLTVGRVIPSDRGVVDSSYDFASIFQFASVEAMQTYLSHPTHIAFLENYARPRTRKTVVYDFSSTQ